MTQAVDEVSAQMEEPPVSVLAANVYILNQAVCGFLDLTDLASLQRVNRYIGTTLTSLRKLPPEVFIQALERRGIPAAIHERVRGGASYMIQHAVFLPSDRVANGDTGYLDRFQVADHGGSVIYGRDPFDRGFFSFVDEDNRLIKTFFQRYSGQSANWTPLSRLYPACHQHYDPFKVNPYAGGGMVVLNAAGAHDERLTDIVNSMCNILHDIVSDTAVAAASANRSSIVVSHDS
jgi:hypothetical protein